MLEDAGEDPDEDDCYELELRYQHHHHHYRIPESFRFLENFQLEVSEKKKMFVRSVFVLHEIDGSTEGRILDPRQITPNNPLGELPGTSVSYKMSTSMAMFGINYTFKKKVKD